MLQYEYDKELLTIEEHINGPDVEFRMKLHRPDVGVEIAVKQIRAVFDDNDIYTDVLFYAHHNEEYQWIVRKDFYVDFVIHMFKHRLVTWVAWAE
ncbi:hypothetical protein [Paenibacillus naphthalenovorans]|uniref:hypothetical protein n=1 Tax=Paenibacillus naphthalenovorans TaxID=162209 RepID=UPI003D2DC024